ncbi:MAG: UDP-3-O-(3-hydroxymyristoyl)glucosamine N-acyltransferase [Muribaculaceae bacterium]|nr:UDP-3-O-(3-hydroxymyristoyl)glucosamine N-acyltransferase [Muribaculaceae bacterium]
MEFTANQIAQLAGGTVEGDGDVKISTFAKIEEGRPGAISFLANIKYTPYIYTTESSAVLVSRDFVPEHPVKATMIRVDDPYATVAHLLTMVQEMLTPKPHGVEQPCFIAEGVTLPDDVYVGAFAYIGRGASIAEGARIYPHVYIGEGVTIGAGTVLYPGVKVYHGCRIGARCIIHAGAVIGADGFGFAPVEGGHYDKIPQIGNVDIADDVEIGANTTVDRAMMGSTRIERGVKLDNLIQIAHNCSVGEWTVMASQTGVAGSTKIGARCMFGGQVGLAGHLSVGDNVQIGAQSGINKNLPDGSRVFGSPAMDLQKYGRQTVNIRNLNALYDRVKNLELRLAEYMESLDNEK